MEQEYTSQQYRQSLPGPTTLQMSPIIGKRPPPGTLERPSSSAPRAIQPKPRPEAERYSEIRPGVPIPRVPEPRRGEPPRKRGRPSKLDIQQRNRRAEEEAARLQPHLARPNHTPRAGYRVGPPHTASPGGPQTPYSPAMAQRPPPSEQMREPDPPTPMSVQYHGTETPPSQIQGIQAQRIPRPQPIQPRVEGGAMLQDSPMIIEAKEPSRAAPDPDPRMSPTSGPVSGNGQRPEGTTTIAATKPESPVSRERASSIQAAEGLEEDKGS
ncbi:AT hook domain-containing protein [Arthroderma uncinatum]|uniref:AT hook domain-containing protein n=1 Tax=Arthroderma uncinatum TaxID=74035 RepID=UPI00144AEC3A|nr:AT hook domain-containing protein [Arthroderma uncinatum]KAF3479783.1 AT hook domain-containing protein [Arthroderma uncinatum]